MSYALIITISRKESAFYTKNQKQDKTDDSHTGADAEICFVMVFFISVKKFCRVGSKRKGKPAAPGQAFTEKARDYKKFYCSSYKYQSIVVCTQIDLSALRILHRVFLIFHDRHSLKHLFSDFPFSAKQH